MEANNEEVPIVHDSPFPGSRLMIREMVLENFKSYAGVKKIGPFHKCFSSVVGPNGSGKSNVIDAMLFVFGKRAKKLRLNKVSELIHNTTENPDCQHAKVTVYFQNIVDREPAYEEEEEAYDVVDGSLLEVSRVAYQSNKSDYFVDGQRKTFTEVAEILQTRGVDLQNNRFLILQGEVEQISLMKPKGQTPHEDGLLEYLEDIIGSNKYVEAIEQATEKVEQFNQVRTEMLNRVKVVEKEKESLEDAKNEAEEFLEKDRLLIQRRSQLVQIKLYEERDLLEKVMEKKNTLGIKIGEEQSRISDDSGRTQQIELELQSHQSDYDLLVAQLKSSKQEFAAFERKDIKFREDMKHAQKTSKELETEAKKEEKNVAKHAAAADKKETEIPALESEISRLETGKKSKETELEDIFDALKGDAEPLRLELEEVQKGLPQLNQQVMEAKNNCKMIQAEIDILLEPVDSNKSKLEASRQKLDDLAAAMISRPKEIQCSTKDLVDAEKQLKTTKNQLAEVVQQESDTDVKLRASRQKFESAKAAFSAVTSRGVVLSSLMEASKSQGNNVNKAGGFHGRLGDLGTIDPQYDVAISTACSALNYLVTESTSGAEACVEYLRQKNIGRATFTILEKIAHLKSKMGAIKTPENVPRLFDLINVKEEKFLPAFYFAMRNTLVAEDMEQAVRIAYEGSKCVWRVVTLKGELIDTSGTMAGGGTKVQKGAMRMASKKFGAQRDEEVGLVSKEEMDTMHGDSETLASDLKSLREKRMQLTREVNRLENHISTLTTLIPKLEMEFGAMKGQMKQLEDTIAALEPQSALPKSDIQKLRELEAKRDSFNQVFEKVNSKLEQLKATAKNLQDLILNVGGEQVTKLKESVNEIDQSIEVCRKNLNKATADVKSLRSKAEKAKEAVEKCQHEATEAEARIEILKQEFKNIEDDALTVLQSLEEAQKLEKTKKANLDRIKGEYEEVKKKSNKVEKILMDMKNQYAEFDQRDVPHREGAISILERKLHQLQNSYSDLIRSNKEIELGVDELTVEVLGTLETLTLVSKEDIKELEEKTISVDIDRLESEVAKLKKSVNIGSIKEYRAREIEYAERVDSLDTATKERDGAREGCESLRKKRLGDFMAGFSIITLKLKEMYQMITLGGDAELELVDSCDPFSEGIVFSVRPPKKSWKNISNLSGGEKTLSSLALVFALHHYKPTPLYVMDEIDAALDFKNVSIVGNYIKERTKNAQFIIISLRNNMFELADRLVGIYKTHNATKSITINPSKVVKAASLMKPARSPLKPLN